MLTRKDDLRRKLLLIRIICLRLITSSNDFTLETIGPTFSGGCSSTALLIDRIWEIIQGYVFNKTWKTEQELAGSFSLSYHFSKSEILPCLSYNFWVISCYFLYFCSPFPKISFCFNTKKKKKKIWNTDVADHTKNKYPPPCSFSTLRKQLQSSVNR